MRIVATGADACGARPEHEMQEESKDEAPDVSMTAAEVEDEIARLRQTFPVVRLLSQDQLDTEQFCLLHGDDCPCMRLVCQTVLAQKRDRIETLRMGDSQHSAVARYVEVDNDPRILLYARPVDEGDVSVSQELLYRDALSGTYNRRYYEDYLRRRHLAAGVAIFDLDDFKLINDTFGHLAGDRAIRTVSDVVRRSIRSTDLLVRYGGDEFVLIIDGISSEDFGRRLRTISENIVKATVEDYPQVKLAASIGGVMARGRSVEEAVHEADGLMYRAKLSMESVLTDSDSLEKSSYRKPRLLIIDDSETNRELLSAILEDEYEILEAPGGREGIAMLENYGRAIAVVLLDIVMPQMSGFEVLSRMERSGWIDDIPVIMISSEDSDEVVLHAYELGASDYINRPFDVRVVRHRVGNVMRLYAKQRRLNMMLAQRFYEHERDSRMMIDIIGGAMELRNGESGPHVRHIRVLTEILLDRLAQRTDNYRLDVGERATIAMASALHDIGKLAIDDKILNKPGRLTAEEFEIMKTHSALGADMLKNLGQYEDSALVKTAMEICRWHHERYDGGGYPDGLKGDAIPISAQVVSLADVYDALTSERVYKAAVPHDEAIHMILDGKCGAFNPLLITCLLDVQDRIVEELNRESTPPLSKKL